MSKSFKIFFISFLISSPFWWGVNVLGESLDNIFYWKEMTSNPQLLTAQASLDLLEGKLRDSKPYRDKEVQNLTIQANSAISVFINNQGKERILFEESSHHPLPIASLTKLMTAKIVLKNYDLAKEIEISKEAILQEENFGKLNAGQILSVQDLLYPLLMESSNDAAYSLANDYDGIMAEVFVELMNAEAQALGLQNTNFMNVTGLDPEKLPAPLSHFNYSSAYDLADLAEELLKTPLIWEILSTKRINLYGPELVSTNKLLGKMPGIIGGKTGYTDEALGCFLLVSEAPKSGHLISVILGSEDRFGEMTKLLAWIEKAYKW